MALLPYAPIQVSNQDFGTLNPFTVAPQPAVGIDRLQATQVSELVAQKNNRTQLQSYSPVEKTLMNQIQLVYNTLNPLNRKKIRKLLWQKTHHTRIVKQRTITSESYAKKLGVDVGTTVPVHHHVEKDTPRNINDKGLKQVYDRARMYFAKQIKSVGTNMYIQARKQLNNSISHQKGTRRRGSYQRDWAAGKRAAVRTYEEEALRGAEASDNSAAGTIKAMLETKEKKKAKRVGRRMAVRSGVAQQQVAQAAANDQQRAMNVDVPQAAAVNPLQAALGAVPGGYNPFNAQIGAAVVGPAPGPVENVGGEEAVALY